jgi:hypothetical protein
MEEIEVPTEHLHETIEEKVEDAIKENEKGWSMYVAISTALIAVLAAISALMAGHHSDEALIAQIKASDQWAYYQAKGIKAEIKELGMSTGKASQADVDKYKSEQDDIKKEATTYQDESETHLIRHAKLARAVTLFQIAIAIAAIAILTRKKFLWYGSMALALIGVWFFTLGIM